MTLGKDHTEAMQVLADVYLQQGQAAKAVVLLRALRSLDPDNQGVVRALGCAQVAANMFEDALATADEFLRFGELSETDLPVLLVRCKALWGLGRAAEAREGLQRYEQLSRGTRA